MKVGKFTKKCHIYSEDGTVIGSIRMTSSLLDYFISLSSVLDIDVSVNYSPDTTEYLLDLDFDIQQVTFIISANNVIKLPNIGVIYANTAASTADAQNQLFILLSNYQNGRIPELEHILVSHDGEPYRTFKDDIITEEGLVIKCKNNDVTISKETAAALMIEDDRLSVPATRQNIQFAFVKFVTDIKGFLENNGIVQNEIYDRFNYRVSIAMNTGLHHYETLLMSEDFFNRVNKIKQLLKPGSEFVITAKLEDFTIVTYDPSKGYTPFYDQLDESLFYSQPVDKTFKMTVSRSITNTWSTVVHFTTSDNAEKIAGRVSFDKAVKYLDSYSKFIEFMCNYINNGTLTKNISAYIGDRRSKIIEYSQTNDNIICLTESGNKFIIPKQVQKSRPGFTCENDVVIVDTSDGSKVRICFSVTECNLKHFIKKYIN